MRSALTFLASIPSPSSGTIDLGPLTIHMYGLMLLAGIAACIAITGHRWVARGGDWDLIFRVAVWGVGAGIVGARLYHLATSWNEVPDEWWGPFAVWEGGLGIWGGIAGGVLVGGLIAHRAGANVPALLDAAAPGLLVAQAIGRVGNWWNQELFGKPTSLPWGLEIDSVTPARRVPLQRDLPPDVPLRGALESLRRRRCCCILDRRYPLPPAGALRALRRALHRLPLLPRDAPDRPVARDRRPARERLGVGGPVRPLRRVLRLVAVLRGGRRGAAPRAQGRAAADDGRPARPRPTAPLASGCDMIVRELELDLDAFEGPFDLLLTLLLKEELEPAEVDMAAIVVAFVERLAEREELDLEACGEFLVLIAALLELKARALFPDEDAELAELEPEEAAEELARRLAEYRRMKEAASWLAERLAGERDRFFRVGPAPLAPRPERKLAAQDPEQLAATLRLLAEPPPQVSLAHMALRFPPVAQFLERFRAVLRAPQPLRLRHRGRLAVARRPGRRVPRAARAAQDRARSRSSRPPRSPR